jgi:hypothetical protein
MAQCAKMAFMTDTAGVTSARFCVRCGGSLVPPARFCSTCGSPVVAVRRRFFVPRFTTFDGIALAVWTLALVVVLMVILESGPFTALDGRPGSASLDSWSLLDATALIIGGMIGGAAIRPNGRWRELLAAGCLIAVIVGLVVIDGFFQTVTPQQCPDRACHLSNDHGADVFSAPAVILIALGGFTGRIMVRVVRSGLTRMPTQ